jgi:hypothetical protein
VRDPVRKLPAVVVEPVHWIASDFVLVSSTPRAAGSRYSVIGRWPLHPGL